MREYHLLELAPRNDPLGLAQRSARNLDLIEQWYQEENEGHVVTQLVQSLLAFIVFPKERFFFDHIKHYRLDSLEKSGWPRPVQVIGETDTLGQLILHMRNAVCHGLVVFHGVGPDGDNARRLEDIFISFADRKNINSQIYWQIAIEGVDLKNFLYKMFEAIDD